MRLQLSEPGLSKAQQEAQLLWQLSQERFQLLSCFQLL